MKKENIKQVLLGFPLFRDLNNQQLEEIVHISISRKWKKGSHVFMQDEPLENFYFIYSGKIVTYKIDTNGKIQIFNFLKDGEMFPHIGFFKKGGYPAFSKVIENATLVAVPISKFEDILIRNPELCINVFNDLGKHIVDLQDRLEEQVLNNTYEQIIKLLIRLGKRHGQMYKDGTIMLKGEFKNKDLANMIGTSRETVSRTLTNLKKAGKIEEDSKGNWHFSPSVLLDELIQ